MTMTDTTTVEGLTFTGTLIRIDRRVNNETGELYPFATAIFQMSSGQEKRLELRPMLRNDAGDIELRAYQILMEAERPSRWQVSVFGTISKPTADGRQFINYTAANAFPA